MSTHGQQLCKQMPAVMLLPSARVGTRALQDDGHHVINTRMRAVAGASRSIG
jgi:hypothetical protein